MTTAVRTDRQPALAWCAGLVAFSAYAGALGLAGGGADMGATINNRLPFHSPVFAALALTVVVGLPTTALAWLAGRRDRRVGVTAVVAGWMLIGWIAVEFAFIRELSWLQPFYVGVGATLLIVGRRQNEEKS